MAKANVRSRTGRRKPQSFRHPRSGIVILVIISILVLFMLVMVTFAVVTGHYRAAAGGASQRGIYDDDPRRSMDSTAYQIISGSSNPYSSLWGHDLLGDLYGNDGLAGTLTADGALQPASGVFVQMNFAANQIQPTLRLRIGGTTKASPPLPEGYYAGCVLTMTSGQCRGLSTRITYFSISDPATYADPTDINDTAQFAYGSLRVETFQRDDGVVVTPVSGDSFIINGKPFNGTGAGAPLEPPLVPPPMPFNPVRRPLYQNDDSNGQVALSPHYPGWGSAANYLGNPFVGDLGPLRGGADEPWDTFDYQNMYLAMVPADTGVGVFPSYHRPDLVNYWQTRFATLYPDFGMLSAVDQKTVFRWPFGLDGIFNTSDDSASPYTDVSPANRAQIAVKKRQFIFRPDRSDNPNFATNSGFDPIDGPWDVDNDSDGVPDSIWIDPGLPVMTAANGRKYKRLVAIMIRDLDGKVHVNAHGTTEFASDYARPATAIGNDLYPANMTPEPFIAGQAAGASVTVPRGIGFGPAEINFLNLFKLNFETDAVAAGYYRQLLQGTNAGVIGRYGVDSPDGLSTAVNRRPGVFGPNAPGTLSNDPISAIKYEGFGIAYNNTVRSNYASMTDVWGRGAFILDYTGHPTPMFNAQLANVVPVAWNGTDFTADAVDTPYEINLVDQSATGDTPYTVAELEAVLRRFDHDANTLPTRLVGNLQPLSTGYQTRAKLVSTISSHIPVPMSAVPKFMRDGTGTYGSIGNGIGNSILDICTARINQETLPPGYTATQVLKAIMPFELFHGERFNINRPFGNGSDDNANGVVDEPLEVNEQAWNSGVFAGTAVSQPLNDNTVVAGVAASDPHTFAKQIYARNLYCMMRLLCDPEFYGGPYTETLTTGPGNQQEELYFRKLAQYAINVVDFRDPDSIMTPFEYDRNPFNGWQVDGDLTTDDSAYPGIGNDRRVVWGMETPDLLLTETKAFHNRRVQDTSHDTSGKSRSATTNPDDDLDQLRLPQGSFFGELYAARSRDFHNPKFPLELYTPAGQLDLKRQAPGGMPVWQIAISAYTGNPGASSDPRPTTLTNPVGANYRPDTFGIEPYDPTSVAPTVQTTTPIPGLPTASLAIQRHIWFIDDTAFPATTPALLQRSLFYNSNNSGVSLQPGQYLVVGPRAKTALGSIESTDPNVLFAGDSPQVIDLTTGNVTNIAGAVVTKNQATEIRPVLTMIADAPVPATWASAGTRRVGVNVTEPLPTAANYYPEPTGPDAATDDGYDKLSDATMSTNSLLDAPLDSAAGMPLSSQQGPGYGNMLASRSYEDCHAIFLQRLANPLVAFDPTTNPYITVDWSTIDVTVFAGDEDTNDLVAAGPAMGQKVDLDDPGPAAAHGNTLRFTSRQRGNETTFNKFLWSPITKIPDPTPGTDVPGASNTYFNYNLRQTLGYVNSDLATPITSAAVANYVGEPDSPFPWYVWNNRPFANPAELLNVPNSSPQRATYDFQFHNSRFNVDPYTITPPPGAPSLQPYYHGYFRHLADYFLSSIYPKDGSAPTRNSDLERLLDYVETPSPYVGTERWYRPDLTAGDNTSQPYGDTYRPLFNRLSRFRDPGRVNLNTVVDREVWNSIVATYPDLQDAGGGFFNSLIQSRRGFGAPDGNLLAYDGAFPSVFANPFRPADSFDLMPLGGNAGMKLTRPIDATFLRGHPDQGSNPGHPLFRPAGTLHSATANAADAYRDTDKNSAIRFQTQTKLANLLTTNSNCFAVWITEGYFEAEPVNVDDAHPDGYRVGQELGLDEGNLKRHRAFYIIDRSIPVGYEPGRIHNVDKCIQLRRFIE